MLFYAFLDILFLFYIIYAVMRYILKIFPKSKSRHQLFLNFFGIFYFYSKVDIFLNHNNND